MQKRISQERTGARARSANRSNPPAREVQGKIKQPAVTSRAVEKRARQLATIGERSTRAVTDSDREEAERELSGPIHPTPRSADEPPSTSTPWDPTVTSKGRKIRAALPTDDQTTKEAVAEGVDEAEHDQMLRARRRRGRG